MAYISPFSSRGSSAGWQTPTVRASAPASTFWGSQSTARVNSYDANPPDRLDVNKIVSGGAEAAGFDVGQFGLQGLDVAGRAPAFIYERPAATAQAAMKFFEEKTGITPYIPVLSEIGGFGASILGGIGDILHTADNFIPSQSNAQRAKNLIAYEGRPDSDLIESGSLLPRVPGMRSGGLYGGAYEGSEKTIGEYRATAAKLGWTEQDLADIKTGKTTAYDYADRPLSENPIEDFAMRFITAPSTWLMFAAPQLALASRIKTFSQLVKLGVELEKPLDAIRAAEAVASGTAKGATLEGLATYAGQIARGEVVGSLGARTAVGLGRGIAGVPFGSQAVGVASGAARGTLRALSLNKKAGLVLSGAEVGLEALHNANTPLSGFMEPLFEFNTQAFNNRPMSDNVAFMMFSAYNFSYGRLLTAGKAAFQKTAYAQTGSIIPVRALEAFAEGQKGLKTFAAKKSWAIERFGGQDNFEELLQHVHANVAFQKLAPELEKTYGHFSSVDEAVLKVANLDNLIVEKVKQMRAAGEFNAIDTVKTLKEWYGSRPGPDGALNAVKFPWNGERAIDQWLRYKAAAGPIGNTLRQRLKDIAGEADIPLPVLQLSNELSREELAHVRLLMGIWSKGGKVENADVRKVLDMMPQLLQNDKSGYWNAFLTDARSANYSDIAKRFRHLEKDAATIRQVTDPQAKAEAAARAVDPLLDVGKITQAGEAPTVNLTASRFMPKSFGVNQSVADAIANRGSAAQAAVEHNIESAMTAAGWNVDHASAVIGVGKNTNHVELVLNEGRLEDLRAAATIYGRSVGAEHVTMSVTGEQMTRMALKPNGVEVTYQLPSATEAALAAVSRALKPLFPDAHINPDTGLVKVLVAEKYADDLANRLASVKVELQKTFPMDNAGNDGITRSINPAYFETIGKTKATSDVTYRSVATSTGHLPQWAAEPLVKSGVSKLDRAPNVDAVGNLRPEPQLGGQPGIDGGAGAPGLIDRAPAQVYGFGDVRAFEEDLPRRIGAAMDLGTPAGTKLSQELQATLSSLRGGTLESGGAVKPGYVYHATPQASVESIAASGLKANAPNTAVPSRFGWAEGGSSKRTWYSDTPDAAFAESPADRGAMALLRVKEDLAGKLYTAQNGTRYAGKSLHPSAVEVLGGDGRWHPLDTYFQNPMGDVPASLQAAASNVAPIWEQVPVAARPDNITAALRYESDVAAAKLAGSVQPEVDAIRQAVYDAQVALDLPPVRLNGAYANAPEVVQAEFEAFNTRLRTELPGYEIGPSPKTAWLYSAEHTPVIGALKQREGLLLWLQTDSPLAPLNRMLDWALHAETSAGLGQKAKNSMAALFIEKGATPKEVTQFTAGLRKLIETQTQTKGQLRAYPQPTSLPAFQINRLAGEIFSKKFIAKVGQDNAYKLLDQASNRFIRGVAETRRAGGKVGLLSAALDTMYRVGQDAPGLSRLRLIKVYYHWFRFLLDPRWHAMNAAESDILASLAFAQRRHGATTQAARASAFNVHAGGEDFTEMAAMTGWYFPRQLEGVMQRSFDATLPDAEINFLNSLSEDRIIGLGKLFPDAKTPKELAAALHEQLYNFDSIGVKATLDKNVTAYATELGRDLRNEELAPILQRLYEVNDTLFKQVVNVFEGNASRTNLERLANSYWLYWPLSYQLKAGKWMVDLLTKRMFGKETGALGAASYAQLMDAHRDGMTNDPEYAQMFADNPSTWFFAQMMFPITPWDMGVSLSRTVRYTGSFLKDVTGGEEGPLGFLGTYKSASDPATAAFAIANMGPIFTWNQLQEIQNELSGDREITIKIGDPEPTDFTSSGAAARSRSGPTPADFTDGGGYNAP